MRGLTPSRPPHVSCARRGDATSSNMNAYLSCSSLVFLLSAFLVSCKPDSSTSNVKKPTRSALPEVEDVTVVENDGDGGFHPKPEEEFTQTALDYVVADYGKVKALPKRERLEATHALAKEYLQGGDTGAVLELLRQIPPGSEGTPTTVLLLGTIGRHSPEIIYEDMPKLRHYLTSSELDVMLSSSAKVFAKRGEHLDALNHAQDKSFSKEERHTLKSSILQYWAGSSPSQASQATAYVLNLKESKAQARILSTATRFLDLESIEVSNAIGRSFDSKLADEKVLSGALSYQVGGMLNQPAEKKAALFSTYQDIVPKSQREEFVRSTYGRWARLNMEEALTNINLIKSKEAQKVVIEGLLPDIQRYDPAAAKEWEAWLKD